MINRIARQRLQGAKNRTRLGAFSPLARCKNTVFMSPSHKIHEKSANRYRNLVSPQPELINYETIDSGIKHAKKESDLALTTFKNGLIDTFMVTSPTIKT